MLVNFLLFNQPFNCHFEIGCKKRVSKLLFSKFRRIGVPTRDSFSRRILKACNLGRVEARYLKPKIVFSRSTNTSPVRNRSNTIVHTRILIRVLTIFSQNASIFVFASKFYKNMKTFDNHSIVFLLSDKATV